MTPATTARTSAAATSTTTSWQMWVPCLGMALCSWLSFVDRQVLNILSPTIIADTGLTPQDFTTATSFFFLTYTLGNPVWGSVLDRVGLRIGMLLAVGVWTAASMSHALMVSFAGFALARAVLGLGEGGTFPGGLRTAVETLPPNLRARGIALSFSGGTIGAVMMPLLLGPLAIQYGWKIAFLATGAFGVLWMLIWATIARPPFLAKSAHTTSKMQWPNLRERRVWALMFSYALPAISPGPVLTILAIYLVQRLHLTQADVNGVVWIPALTWGIGYFFWGWAADRYAANNPRPIGMFMLLTVISLTLGLTTMTASLSIAIALISLSTFIGGGFQMVALKVGSYAFPREQSAMMSGIASGSWSLVNFVLLNAIGAGVAIGSVRILPGANLISGQRWEEIFWIIALMPAAGVAIWMFLSRDQAVAARG
ncbi:MAG TPA: MFS transporter [Vicinamibacterales bacterium]|nr:MFS transporter [Vicinamibacterales bacterium]